MWLSAVFETGFQDASLGFVGFAGLAVGLRFYRTANDLIYTSNNYQESNSKERGLGSRKAGTGTNQQQENSTKHGDRGIWFLDPSVLATDHVGILFCRPFAVQFLYLILNADYLEIRGHPCGLFAQFPEQLGKDGAAGMLHGEAGITKLARDESRVVGDIERCAAVLAGNRDELHGKSFNQPGERITSDRHGKSHPSLHAARNLQSV